jgi:hypothetical protein
MTKINHEETKKTKRRKTLRSLRLFVVLFAEELFMSSIEDTKKRCKPPGYAYPGGLQRRLKNMPSDSKSKELKVGDKAPAFSLKNTEGKTVKLSDYEGKKVVLYFYPKDDTPGCTKEACGFRDDFAQLGKRGVEVIGVSGDDQNSHQKFTEKYSLPFTPAIHAAVRSRSRDDGEVWRVGREEYVREKVDGRAADHIHHRRGGEDRASVQEG